MSPQNFFPPRRTIMKKFNEIVFLAAMALATMVFAACNEQGVIDYNYQPFVENDGVSDIADAAIEAVSDVKSSRVEVTVSAPADITVHLVVVRFGVCSQVGIVGSDDTCDVTTNPSPNWGTSRPTCTAHSFVWDSPNEWSHSFMVYRSDNGGQSAFVSATVKVGGRVCGTFGMLIPAGGYLWRFGGFRFEEGVSCSGLSASHLKQIEVPHKIFADDGLKLDPTDQFFPASYLCESVNDSKCAKDLCGAQCTEDSDCQRDWHEELGVYAYCGGLTGHCIQDYPGCDDSIPCTKDVYIQGKGCTHTPDDTFCDDGDPSTPDECRVVYPEGWLSGCYNE